LEARPLRGSPTGTEEVPQADEKRLAMRRKKYPEVCSKVVDYITDSIDGGTLYS